MPIDVEKIKILVVEDAATMRKIEVKTLKQLGFRQITEAENGAVAIATLQKEESFDLIISDWNMPEKSGFDLLQWVRANEKVKNIPFLMATGQGDKKQEKAALDAGVSSFVAKPFNQDELKTKIEEAFGIDQGKTNPAQHDTACRETRAGKVLLRIAHIQIADHLVLGVLKHMIDKGDVRPKHFELETQCMASWNLVQDALEKGKVDAACILAPIAMDLYNFGVPIKLVLLAHKNGSIFVRSTQGNFKTPYQDFFRQRSFLIPHKMSIHHMLSHLFFTGIGLKAGMVGEGEYDVHFEIVAPIKMQDYLSSNAAACGFMVAEPLGTRAIAAGVSNLQFLSSDLWEQHPCCVVAMRDDFIEPYTEAVYEFVEMLVQAGKFIEKKPETAAEIGVAFLDPQKKLGLKIPILKNVLKEAKGIKTGDLFPSIQELDHIQRYMFNKMGVGSIIDLEKFVDTRFAMAACKDRSIASRPTKPNETAQMARELLRKGVDETSTQAKTMLSREGKYLTFSLGTHEFGIGILKIREIIGMLPIRSVPMSPPFVRGVINLRDKVVPVMDVKQKFGLQARGDSDRSCIIVMEFEKNGASRLMGIPADRVSEVIDIKATDIEAPPSFGVSVDTRHILGMAKIDGGVKILLDIDHVLHQTPSMTTETL